MSDHHRRVTRLIAGRPCVLCGAPATNLKMNAEGRRLGLVYTTQAAQSQARLGHCVDPVCLPCSKLRPRRITHGAQSSYSVYGCRCLACLAAQRLQMRRTRARRKRKTKPKV